MAKTVHNDVLDGATGVIKSNCNLMTACSAEPTTRTEAITTFALADVAMASGDFTQLDGDTSGRKVTVTAKPGIVIDISGTATHIALVDGTRLLYVTSCASQALTANGSNQVDFPAWDIELRDPT